MPPMRVAAALTLAALLLLAGVPQAQKFPGNLPVPGVPAPGGAWPSTAKSPTVAQARPRPAAAPAPAQADLPADALHLQAGDPPAVVGRIARVSGTASLRLAGGEEWRGAVANTALIAGNALWVEPGARAAIDAGPVSLALDGGTALQIDALDEQGLRATLAQGTVFLRLSGAEGLAGMVDIATPEASIATAIDSRILIEAAQDGRPGRVTVFEGGAEITLASSADPIRLGAGQAVAFAPGAAAPAIEAAGAATPLIAWALGTAPRGPVPVAARGMTGIEELTRAGRWERSAEYGDVWYPPVDPGWVPCSDGSWEWRDPWGWTWVDAEPWGYAPSHYGRWVQVGPHWGWAPAPVPVAGLPPLRPVWAPALVSFFDGPPVPGGGGRPIGWIPLGPREPWYPWYRASPAYVARANARQVPQMAPVRQHWMAWGGPERRWDGPGGGDGPHPGQPEARRFDAYRNRAAATLVPERTMLASAAVRPEARRVGRDLLRRADAPSGMPLRPGPETRGLSPRAAERFGLPPEALGRDRAPAPPASIRTALPDAAARPEGPRRPAAESAPALRQRLLEEQGRPAPAGPSPRPPGTGPEAIAPRQASEVQRQQMEQSRRQQDQQMQRQQVDQSRRQQDQMQRQQVEQSRRQREQMQRQQMDQSRRQQDQMQRQQMEQSRRQQDQMQRRQMDQSRRQQEQMQRQQMEQSRRQQEQMQRQQMEQSRRQQERQMQRQQMEQSRRQQDQMQRQQMEQSRRQQEQMQRHQQDQARRPPPQQRRDPRQP